MQRFAKRIMFAGLAAAGLLGTAVVRAESDPAHENLLLPLTTAATSNYAAAWDQPLMPAFDTAARVYNVPKALLLALAQLGSNFENRNGAPTIERGYGVMALRDNPTGGDSLATASLLTGLSIEQLKLDPAANIRGAAAAMSEIAKKLDIDRGAGLDAWSEVVTRYAALDADSSQYFAMEVYQRLHAGFSVTNSMGETFTLAPQTLQLAPESLAPQRLAPDNIQSPDYGPAISDFLSCNYSSRGGSGINAIIIHTIEGSAAGARGWMHNCSSQVSSHYVVSEAGGVWQMVLEANKAWHVGCLNARTIGIEHEGFAGSPSHPQALYNASGDLCHNICDRRGIPKAYTPGGGPGILGHVDANNCCCHSDHWDPGPGWDWNYFIGRVGGGGGGVNNVGDFVSETIPEAMRINHSYNCSVTMKNSGSQIWACWPSGTMLTVGQFTGPAVCKLIPYPFLQLYTNPCVVEVAQNCTFPFTLNIPGDSPIGNYDVSWQMKDNNEWFNTSGHNAVFHKSVYIHDNASSFDSDTIPSAMSPGFSYNCTVRMKNAGGQTWAAWPTGHMLTVGQFTGPEVCKLIPFPFYEIYIPQDGGSLPDQYITKPSAICSFPFTINVPADTAAGTYQIQWHMKDNGFWFDEINTKNVTIGGGNLPNKAGSVANTIPGSVQRGQSYNCSISMQNTGVGVWAAWPLGTMLTVSQGTGPVANKIIPSMIQMYIPQNGGSSPDEYITNPGSTCVFPFTLNIPSDTPPGTYQVKWQMKDNNEWFNSDTHTSVFTKNVVVQDPAPPAISTAVSRKAHGGLGNFDIDVRAAGAVEPRNGGPTTLVVTFDKAIERVNNTLADVSLSSGAVGSIAVSGSQLTVGLSGASTAALIVGFPGIRPSGGGSTVAGTVCFGVLSGDVTADRTVNIFDLVAVRNVLNATVAAGNARNDVTADGSINIFDLVAVRNTLNTSVSACP